MDNHNHYESITKVYSRVWLKNTKDIKLIRVTNKKNQLVKAIQRIKMQALSCPSAKEEQVQELKRVLREYNHYIETQITELKEASIDYTWLFQDTNDIDVSDLVESDFSDLPPLLDAAVLEENNLKKRKLDDALSV